VYKRQGLSDANSEFNRNRTDGFSGSAAIYRGHHNITVGGDFRKQQYNDFFEQNPRGDVYKRQTRSRSKV